MTDRGWPTPARKQVKAPTVAAVVVAHNPGDWFEETLESLALQDYEELKIAVVDAAGTGLESVVKQTVSDAVMIDAPSSRGFSDAANAVFGAGLDADYLLICHDDVALAPDVVSTLVAEALRSRASVVAPKLVDWDRPEVIRQAGYDVDRFGFGADRASAGELDQEQHDRVTDVFAVPSAVMLVRRSLFRLLGGFDAEVLRHGEDIDFCWRAQMAGARVIFVGAAVVRHRGRVVERRGVDDTHRLKLRHSLRAMLVNHGRISLIIFVPLALLLALVEVLICIFTARLRRAANAMSAWSWNFARLDVVVRRRGANSRVRKIRQADVTAMQYKGSLRMTSYLMRHFSGDRHGLLDAAGRTVIGSFRTGSVRVAAIVGALATLYVLYGSRDLISSGVPAIGDFTALGDSGFEMFQDVWQGWSQRGAGAPSSNLPAIPFVAIAGWILNNSIGLLRTSLVLAPIFVGLLGAYRLLAASGSRRAQTAAMVAYLVVPLMPASLAGGSIPGMVGYAAAPWILRALLWSLRAAPFRGDNGGRGGNGGTPGSPSAWAAAVSLGVAAGLAAMAVPAVAGLIAIFVVGLIVGSVVAGRPGGTARVIAACVMALPTMALLNIGLVVDLVASGVHLETFADGRDGSAGSLSLAEILQFTTPEHVPGRHVWLFVLPMALPLVLGRGWRLEQAVRFWIVAIAAWALVLLAQRGVLSFGLPDTQLLLAPAAVAVAALCGLTVLCIEHDLRSSHFGWRQALVPVVAIASLGLLGGSIGLLDTGRWGLAPTDHSETLRFEPEALEGSYRVAWIGQPEFLPVEGRSLTGGLAWAVTSGEEVTIIDRAVPADAGSSELFEDVLSSLIATETSRGGRLLAGLGVRYVVVVHRLSPAPFSPAGDESPSSLVVPALRSQLDLELRQGTNRAVDIFENTAWVPARSVQAAGFDRDITSVGDLLARPLSGGSAIFSGDGPPWSAPVPSGVELLVTQTPRPGWDLTLDGEPTERREALGWTRAYDVSVGGGATLSYSPPRWRQAGLVAGLVAPVLLLLLWTRRSFRRLDRG